VGKKKDLRVFEQGMGSRCQLHRFVSRTVTLLGFSRLTVSCVYQEGPPPKRHPANLTQLWEALESTRASIPVEHLVESFSQREAVLRAKKGGGATQY
jgi:hypothetical protein